MASQDWFEKDFYAVLGVSPDADAKEIKSKYRKLARTYHPDSKPGDAAAEKRFKEIGEAYAVLSDAEERKQYDAVRAMSRGGARFSAGGAGGPGGAAGFDDVFSTIFNNAGAGGTRFTTSGGGFGGGRGAAGEPDLEDLLSMFGQGGFAPGGAGSQFGGAPGAGRAGFRPRKGRDLHATASLAFRQAVEGDTVVVSGVGGKSITARIPAGVKDGSTIRLRGKGEPGPGGAPAGDILLKISVTPHEVFTRDGDNLTVDVPVTFAEAALGATIAVPTLSGESVKVKLPAGIASGKTLRVRGRGVARKGGGAGDLLVRVQVLVPQRLTDEAREAVEVLQRLDAGIDPREDVFRKARSS
ncbi:DnaJ C-terminal domain-containing protein [Gephyromycinifex aptenodytis]|uniref:DnaJ C-terminal domain-containing protein n=1 Tax=Gephyromycinifex aptenodytis TaxID=2716227 RepID=UPI0014464D2D|nr:DnaJ C-terminal domain-containing protein [Gephyromycinifex aptenodytis]